MKNSKLSLDLALKNIARLCLSLYEAVINAYKTPSDLFEYKINEVAIRYKQGGSDSNGSIWCRYSSTHRFIRKAEYYPKTVCRWQ